MSDDDIGADSAIETIALELVDAASIKINAEDGFGRFDLACLDEQDDPVWAHLHA